ncbi:MAG: PKD domain-containing protein [Bacteroidota bacterium]
MKQLLLISILFCSLGCFAQKFPHLTFQRFYDNVGKDSPSKIVKSQDGHLLIGGNTITGDKETANCPSIWIIKVDTTGEMIWEQEIALTGCEEIRDMTPTEDGGVMFVGVTSSLILHEEQGDEQYWGDFFLGKLDGKGTIEWLESYGGSKLEQANTIVEGVYREFFISGVAHSSDGDVKENNGMSDIWTLKVDTKGNPRYSKVIGENGHDWASAMTLSKNGDYLLAGFTNSPGWNNARTSHLGNGLLMRMSQSGTKRWAKSFYCPNGGYFTDIKETKSDRIILVGKYVSEKSYSDFWWMVLTSDGRRVADYRPSFPANEELNSVKVLEDGGFIFSGFSTPVLGKQGKYSKGGDDFWLIRTNSVGKRMWTSTYGGPNDERCSDVIEYRKGVYYAVGEKENFFTKNPSSNKDFWLLRIDEMPADSIQANIFVRAKNNRIDRKTPTRFRAKYKYGDRFLWDFGDGTTSTEPNPLKSFDLPGLYDIKLTIFANESCRQTVKMKKGLEVW